MVSFRSIEHIIVEWFALKPNCSSLDNSDVVVIRAIYIYWLLLFICFCIVIKVTCVINILISQTGWMMWNWYVSSLAVGSSIVCYDGSPLVPHINVLWDLVDKLKLVILNCIHKKYVILESPFSAPFSESQTKHQIIDWARYFKLVLNMSHGPASKAFWVIRKRCGKVL